MAGVVKGLIISLSIITALSVAVLENPQIQVWLEEQRRKIADLLRSIGEDLDPESRRQAEAFAFEGRTPATHTGLRREASGSRDAVALATGRVLPVSPSTLRRIPVSGPKDPDLAEERRRRGREYLAKRNQQMMELQEKRKAAKADGTATPPSPTSFDAIVDQEGNLRNGKPSHGTISMLDKELPSPPAMEPVPEHIQAEMREVERHLVQPLLAGESSTGFSGFSMGSALADPFSDEFALDRSDTPKPPVPPKVQLDRNVTDDSIMPGSFSSVPPAAQIEEPTVNQDELSYEEQLAIALSLSEAESSSNGATVRQRQPDEHDAELKAAIAASLRDMDDQHAAHAIAHDEPVTPKVRPIDSQPLVDLTPPSLRPASEQPETRRDWETMFEYQPLPSREPLMLDEPSPSEDSDELYRITPELTRARLATLDAQQQPLPSTSYDPVREAAESHTMSPQPQQMEASFYSAPSSASPPPSDRTLDHVASQPVNPPEEPTRSPVTLGFESDSDSDTFASMSRSESRAPSGPRSEISNIEVVDVEEDSDVDMLSEDGNGVLTPDSWTEVGSRDGESEAGDFEQHVPARSSL